MLNRAVLTVLGMLLVANPAFAQDNAVDPALLAQGQGLYEENCASCHQSNGMGAPPSFPALAANERLMDLNLIVSNVHLGKGAMPAFPDLTADQIAALATYIRNSWGNAFGGVTAEAVTTELAALPEAVGQGAAGAQLSVWDGVYTEAQAARGAVLHAGVCAKCHGERGDGANEPDQPGGPAIARGTFIRNWSGRSLAALFQYIKKTMPPDNPGSRTDQEYVDAIAQMLALSRMPAGETELMPDVDALTGIQIGPDPAGN